MSEDNIDRQVEALAEWFRGKFREAKLVDIFTIGTGIALLLVGVIAACIYYGQLAAMRQTNKLTQQALAGSDKALQRTLGKMQAQVKATEQLAKAASRQAAAVEEQFQTSKEVVDSQRARITITPSKVLNSLVFPPPPAPRQMTFAFALALRNAGSFTATHVHMRFRVIFVHWGAQYFREPLKKQEQLCTKRQDEHLIIKPPTLNIAPGGVRTLVISSGGEITDADLFPWPPAPQAPTERVLQPMVVGCVDYQSGAIPGLHQTGFIFELQEASPGMPTFIRPGHNLAPGEVVVSKYYFSQGRSF